MVYRGHLINWKGTEPTELVAVKTLREGASINNIMHNLHSMFMNQTCIRIYSTSIKRSTFAWPYT